MIPEFRVFVSRAEWLLLETTTRWASLWMESFILQQPEAEEPEELGGKAHAVAVWFGNILKMENH